MDDIGRYLWGTVLVVLLVLIAMFFSAAATAAASLSGSTLKRLAEEEEDPKAIKLYDIKKRQFDFSLYAGASTLLLLAAAALIATALYIPAQWEQPLKASCKEYRQSDFHYCRTVLLPEISMRHAIISAAL